MAGVKISELPSLSTAASVNDEFILNHENTTYKATFAGLKNSETISLTPQSTNTLVTNSDGEEITLTMNVVFLTPTVCVAKIAWNNITIKARDDANTIVTQFIMNRSDGTKFNWSGGIALWQGGGMLTNGCAISGALAFSHNGKPANYPATTPLSNITISGNGVLAFG